MVRLSPDGARTFVTSRGAEGTLSVISLNSESAPVVIPTGAGAEGLAVTKDGREVWVVRTVHVDRFTKARSPNDMNAEPSGALAALMQCKSH